MTNKLVTLVLTDTDCLSLRLALNAHAMEWGDKASEARKAGNDFDAATCERVRADYHRLWDVVNVAQEAGGREPDWLARREAEMAILNAVIPDEPIVTTAKAAMFGDEAQWEASIERGAPRLDFVNNRGE